MTNTDSTETPNLLIVLDVRFEALQWGYGSGLMECQLCRALVLPDGTERHKQWHNQESK